MTQDLQIPIMCTLTADDLQTRKMALQADFFSGVQRLEPTDHGYRLDFPATAVWLEKITQFITIERDCCAFLSFELTIPAQAETASLHIYGGEGVKSFLESQLSIAEPGAVVH